MIMANSIYKDGKIFKELDFQIIIKKVDIKNLEISIDKAFHLAGVDGPKGENGLGVDYSRVISTTPVAHIGLEDAIRLAARDQKRISELKKEISELNSKKKKLIKILESLEGIEEKIFFHRVIMCETQEVAADKIGMSCRNLQRYEKNLKLLLKVNEMSNI